MPYVTSSVQWRKSSRSGGNGHCVEVAKLTSVIAVRDSKQQTGPVLDLTPTQWRTFIADVKGGQFEL